MGARSVGGGFSSRRLANEFIHSLVPIALAYVAAHYLTLLLIQGQSIVFLDPYPKLGVLAPTRSATARTSSAPPITPPTST